MAGDKISTDIQGAANCGICSALMMTGEYCESSLSGEVRPDFCFDSIRDLCRFLEARI